MYISVTVFPHPHPRDGEGFIGQCDLGGNGKRQKGENFKMEEEETKNSNGK
jgi:hypothetical protein